MATPTPAEVSYWQTHLNDNRIPTIVVVDVVCFTAASIAIILRFISRSIMKIALKADDWMILVGLFFSAAVAAGPLVLTRDGFGRHANYVHDVAFFDKLITATEVLYNPAALSIKTSILLLLKRLFPGKTFERVLFGTFLFVLFNAISQIFANIFQCIPVSFQWDTSLHGHCSNIGLILIFGSVFNVASDFFILFLPLFRLWKLQVSRTKKTQLFAIFLFGTFAGVASIMRAVVIINVSLSDPGWADVGATMWTTVETTVGIISACMPTLRPICRQSRKRDTAIPAIVGDRAYTRFLKTWDPESKRQRNHELQTFASSSLPEIDIESSSQTGSNGVRDIRKTVHFNLAYHNKV